jgi:gamma-D-glutamyl-L-lysine dipeptidyl-peptidase
MSIESVNNLLSDLSARFPDRRIQLMDVKAAALDGDQLSLQGRVLDDGTFQALQHAFEERLPDLVVDLSGVRVLRQGNNACLHVATNLTSVHAEPSWLAEMLTQNTFGAPVEQLDEQGRWVLIRQADGYLGWMYRPYLTEQPTPSGTYLVASPVTPIHAEPNADSPLQTRLMAGTLVQVVSTRGAWAEIDANVSGWVAISDLRALDHLPKSIEMRRKAILNDGATLLGVPYLWGGTSVNGIDCSGLAQLLHRWIGITIPRDADMQYAAGRKVEPPFQPGDLLFFGEKGEKRSITHVGISTGGWHIIHSSRSRNGVYYDDVEQVEHLRDSYLCAASHLIP